MALTIRHTGCAWQNLLTWVPCCPVCVCTLHLVTCCWCTIHSCVLGAVLQKGSLAEEYGGIILLLRRRLLVADSGKQHLTAADVNSNKVSRQCRAVDLLNTVAAVSCAK